VSRRAVFLDRDGTIIRDTDFVGAPEKVELLSGAAAAIRRLNEAGVPVVVVTNQSGIARGYFTAADYDRVQARVAELLAAAGARLDATYVCPHGPDDGCECRKPGTRLFRQAAGDHDLALEGSWYVGDKLRDISPARALRGTGILVPSDRTPEQDLTRAHAEYSVARSLDEVAGRVIESAR